MSYKLDVLKDNPVAFWMLDETSGSIAYDSSPYGNNAEYFGSIDKDNLPIVSDGKNSKLIDNSSRIEYSYSKDFIGNENTTAFGTKETSDNDFTIECWVYLNIQSPLLTPIVADLSNNIGIFWQNGNIVFKAKNNVLNYAIPNSEKALHIVGVYTSTSLSLYINGALVKVTTFDKNIFSNSLLYLKTGPTRSTSDLILIDSVSLYRYSLNSIQINNHYFSAQTIPSIQIAHPDNGQLFQIYDTGASREFKFAYPADKSWKYFHGTQIVYNQYEESLSLSDSPTATNVSAQILDLITVPLGFNLNSSKIEWKATKGVDIYASVDNITFIKCQNGGSIPRYKYGSNNFEQSKIVYLSIRFSSSDTSLYVPKIYDLMISFYNDKKIYASNGGAVISHLSDSTLDSDISFGNYYSPVLFRDSKNGLLCRGGSGFGLTTKSKIKTIEFFYTPKHITFLKDSLLVDIAASITNVINAETNDNLENGIMVASEIDNVVAQSGNLILNTDGEVEYSWGIDGTIYSSNIASIFVNGVDKTIETQISNVLSPGKLTHIVIVLNSEISGEIAFNKSVRGSVEGLYQNIAIYADAFTESKIMQHLDLWTGRYKVSASDSSFTIAENSVSTFGNDWMVIQTT